MLPEEATKRFLDALLEKTRDAKVKWAHLQYAADGYTASVDGRYAVTIYGTLANHRLIVEDDEGRELLRMHADDEQFGAQVREVYRLASQSATASPEKLNDAAEVLKRL